MLQLFEKYKITKPIRLIELFAGYGSQALALDNMGIKYEHYKVVEFDKYAIKSYNSLHGTNFKTEDITKVYDLNIVDKDKYEYIMTYSFPCTDLSLAGKQAGMCKGTRSGLLWEVERLLNTNELPQILVMENVPQVHGNKFKEDFTKWTQFLAKLGYSNQWKDLNSKDYGIPQNRNRTFMVSILGNYEYHFPIPQVLKLRLKDMLENDVDEKYYLSAKMVQGMKNTKFNTYSYDNIVQEKNGISNTILARFEGAPKCIETNKNIVINPLGGKTNYGWHFEQQVYDINGIARTIKAGGGSGNIPKILNPTISIKSNLKTKLCNELVINKIVKGGEVINHSYTNSAKNKNSRLSLIDYIETHNGIMPTLTTRGDILGVVVKSPNIKSVFSNLDTKMITKNGNIKRYINSDIIDIFGDGDCADISFPNGYNKGNRVYKGFSPTINGTTVQSFIVKIGVRIRKFTPRECFRLMGLNDLQIDKLFRSNNSNAQLYKQAGNSIVVQVLEEIFKNLLN